ncbi:MAG TPA: hypothetical protein VLA37_09640 [Sphingomonadaceae bacterium]|nr:hypothetical protein [Sphingomonadaceae bacterium]
MPDIPIRLPANYAPVMAVGFADQGGNFTLAAEGAPLPVILANDFPGDVAPPPLAGTTAVDLLAGPYEPVTGKLVILQLEGTWTGTVQLMRASAAAAGPVPVTIGGLPWASFTGNACEPVWEESEAGAQLFLDIQLQSGSLAYRVSQ